MLELAEHAEMMDRPAVDCAREEDATATKEAITFLFKQIMGCITDLTSQASPLFDSHGDVFDKDITDKDLIITQCKTIIKQLQETNKEIINKQTQQMHSLREHFDNLRTCVDLREASRQKLEFSSVKLKAEIIKIKQQVTDHEQKTEIKALHHSEDVHSLQQLVQRLVSGETRDANVLSMSQGGSLFQNPNTPSLSLRDSAPLLTRDHLRDNGISSNLHTLFDSKLRTSSSAKHSSTTRRRGLDLMDTDVVVSGEHEAAVVSGSLRDLHDVSRADLHKDMIVVDKNPAREVYEIPRDIREKRDTKGAHEVPRRNGGARNGSYANFESTEGSLHIEDEGEESDRKRLKTDAERQRVQTAKPPVLRNTHPRSPHMSPHMTSPRTTQSPLQPPNYPQHHQAQGQRTTNNMIKKLSSSSGSPPHNAVKPGSTGTPLANGQKKEPSEISISLFIERRVLLAFSQGADSPTDITSPLAASADLKRRLSCDELPPPPNNNSLIVSGGVTNGNADNAEDHHTTIRRISDELALRRSSGAFDEYSFTRSSGGLSMGSLSASGHKKRRGKLPETATSLLKRWLLEHQQHPYPTEEEKAGLATTTSLTLNQINNWFTNARRRILPKQKHSGSPPSSPPPSSSGATHNGSHDDHELSDSNSHSISNTTSNNNNSNAPHTDTPRQSNPTTPTSPIFSNHSIQSTNNTNTPQQSSTSTQRNSNSATNLQNPSALLSQLAHTSALSTPLMAQLTAQLAQRLSANPSQRPAPISPSTTILSLSAKRSGDFEPALTDIKSATEIDDTPTTALHTISLATKIDSTPRESPITISSEVQKHHQSKFHSAPLRISSPTPPVINPSTSSLPPTTATLTPAAILTTTSTTIRTTPLASLVPSTTLTSIPSTRPPIFPSHPFFSQSPTSALSALAQLGVSVVPTQPSLDTPQSM